MKNLDLLIPAPPPEPTDSFTWATVTSVEPVRVRLDGESEPLDVDPDCLLDPGWLEVGRRVWVQRHGRRIIVLGQTGSAERIPTGTIAMYAGTTDPEGWMLCDGRARYTWLEPRLFAAIGYTYGGSGEIFNLPDLRGRFPKQAPLGEKGGANSRTLTVAQMPAHSHSINHSHSGTVRIANSAGNSGATANRGTAYDGGIWSTTAMLNISAHSGNSGSAGSGQAFDNQPAYLGVNFIIKL